MKTYPVGRKDFFDMLRARHTAGPFVKTWHFMSDPQPHPGSQAAEAKASGRGIQER